MDHSSSFILALDPGTTNTGVVELDFEQGTDDGVPDIHSCAIMPNAQVLDYIRGQDSLADVVACEQVRSYGMAVGKEVFETVTWCGRFQEAVLGQWTAGIPWLYVPRLSVKLHLTGSPRAKDANIRQAILDRYPATGGGKTPQVGTKSQPGPLFGVKSHIYAAIGVGLTAYRALMKPDEITHELYIAGEDGP
jgi:hypothetical protein